MLQPLTDAYAEWIQRERAKVKEPSQGLADFERVALQSLERCERTPGTNSSGISLLEDKDKPIVYEASAS